MHAFMPSEIAAINNWYYNINREIVILLNAGRSGRISKNLRNFLRKWFPGENSTFQI